MTTRPRRSDQWRKPKKKIIIPDRVAKRAGTSYVEDENGCWISTYSVASHGYAQIGWQDGEYRQVVVAHRASWVYANDGQIPDGMTIDHTCKVKRCVNPAHLRLLPNFENARRTSGRDWPLGQCIHGHPNSELILKSGKWVCRICSAEWQRRYREKKRQEAA
ncbi:HNH endonuclease signature motif containing protein [Corynebacterium variabile]|uniref:HNH endonuclease signature motif containing protein n=1 Tax=Corynebacterium variabile TaxID=1727 RepID=UPI00289B3E43|nr:HNH endonuclease signature motif containing protein [Corynebacterium variabile]